MGRIALTCSLAAHGVVAVVACFVVVPAGFVAPKAPQMSVESSVETELEHVDEVEDREAIEERVLPALELAEARELPVEDVSERAFAVADVVAQARVPSSVDRLAWIDRLTRRRATPVQLEPPKLSTPREPQAVAPAAPTRARLRPLARPAPSYPSRARRNGWTGSVRIAVVVDERGRVTNRRLVESSGHAVLDEAALAAVMAWRFAGGPGETTVELRFRLS